MTTNANIVRVHSARRYNKDISRNNYSNNYNGNNQCNNGLY